MKQAGKHSRHHTVLTRLLHNRNSYRTSSILLQTTNHFVTVAPSPSSFLPFVSLLPILRIPIRCCNQRRNKFFRKENFHIMLVSASLHCIYVLNEECNLFISCRLKFRPCQSINNTHTQQCTMEELANLVASSYA